MMTEKSTTRRYLDKIHDGLDKVSDGLRRTVTALENVGEFLLPGIEYIMEKTATKVDDAVGEVVYSHRKGLKQYEIIKAPATKLEEWKGGVDEFIKVIREKDIDKLYELMRKGDEEKGDYRETVRLIAHEKLDDRDIILLSIGLFILRHKGPWDRTKTGIKTLVGGKMPMESVFESEGWPNCYDVSAVSRELAKMYDIEGEIKVGRLPHAHFETNDRKVLDCMYGWQRGGLFQTREQYDKFKKDLGPLGKLGLKKKRKPTP